MAGSRTALVTTVDLPTLHAIIGKLDASKSAGWLSDYLVAWHGPSGKLLPRVTVWRAADRSEEAVRGYVSGLLGGLVSAADIFIARN